MKTLTVTLKQHTPLIHFQPGQYGATLRASEVKPKLDRFILGKLGKEVGKLSKEDYLKGVEEARRRKWLIGKGDHPALNYKMRIIPLEEVEVWEINPLKEYNGKWKREMYPLFFANMSKNDGSSIMYKQFSFVPKLKMELFFPEELDLEKQESEKQESLYDWIIKQRFLSRFFFFTNFGTRSSKGFGSFYPSEEDNEFVPFGKDKYLFDSKYFFDVDVRTENSMAGRSRCLFENIELLYKALRGGINVIGRRKFKFPSLMQYYSQKVLKRDWEKQGIVNDLNKEHVPENNFYDVKDLLGFSKQEKWKAKYNTTITKAIALKDENNGQWRKPKKEEEKDLPQRMKSPILFKPFYDEKSRRYIVYIRPMAKTVNLSEFLSYRKICVTIQSSKHDLYFDLPESFVIADFLDYVFRRSNLNFSEYVERRYQNHSDYNRLKSIYDKIVNNLKNAPKQ